MNIEKKIGAEDAIEITSIEQIFSMPITYETDQLDCLLIMGWTYGLNPIYQSLDKKLMKQIWDYVADRRAALTRQDKLLESKFSRGCVEWYYDRNVITLGDLKSTIEREGIRRMRYVGYKSLARFNQALSNYGLEEITVGGKYAYEGRLRKYGLKPSKETLIARS